MVWKLFVLDKSPLVIDLVSVPAAQIRLNKRSWSEVHSIDMNTIFYDFVIDAARRITAIQLQIGPDHPVSEFVTSVSNMNYIEFCPCLRIWLSSARIGDECGLEAFGDLRLFRDCQATPALVMDPENWLPHSTV